MSSKSGTVGLYLGVFGALMLGTIITVWVAMGVDLGRPMNIAVGILIACAKASLVALFFMHLKFETKLIWGAAIFPLILFLILIFALMPDVGMGETNKRGPAVPVEHKGH
jgi:cytochrome c oxidase subunit 4